MPALLLFSPNADLLKGYVKAHTRVLKNGRTIEIAAHYDKRTKKGAEHAPGHGHDTGHLSESDRERFDRMHAEQHLLHHYHGHGLRQRIAEHEATIADLHAQAKAHSEAGRHKDAAKLANRALKLNAKRLRHQRALAKVEAAVADLGRMKEALVQGSGAVEASTEATHAHYTEKLGPSLNTKADPYERLQTRPGTTEPQRELGRDALADLAARVRGSLRAGGGLAGADSGGVPQLLGARLYSEYVASGGNALVGQTVKTAHDLAHLAQVYRDPRFETFRAVFINDQGQIVGESAYSNRLPGAVRFPEPKEFINQLETDRYAFGASGFWVMHNHPSGRGQPSQPDVDLTKWLGDIFKKHKHGVRMLGHVVIDHNEYGHIKPNGTYTVVKDETVRPRRRLQNQDYKADPDIPHPLLDRVILSPSDAAMAARDLREAAQQAPTLIMTGHDGQVNAVLSIPPALLSASSESAPTARLHAWLRRLGRRTGAGNRRFLVVSEAAYHAHSADLDRAMEQGTFSAVISADTGRHFHTGFGTSEFLFAPRRAAKKLKLDTQAAKAATSDAPDYAGIVGRHFSVDAPEEYGPSPRSEAAIKYIKTANRNTIALEQMKRPSGKSWYTAYVANGDGEFESYSIGSSLEGVTRERIIAEADRSRARTSAMIERRDTKISQRQDRLRELGVKPGYRIEKPVAPVNGRAHHFDSATVESVASNGLVTLTARKRGMKPMRLIDVDPLDSGFFGSGLAGTITKMRQAESDAQKTPVPLTKARGWWGAEHGGTHVAQAAHQEGHEAGGSGESSVFVPDARQADAYRKQLDKALNSRQTNVEALQIGDTPKVLQALGVPALPITISRDVVRKATNGVKHHVALDTIRQLPELLADPVMVLRSATEREAHVVVVDAADAHQAPVLVALHVSVKEKRHIVNRVASVYGKDHPQALASWIEQGLLQYRHTQKSLEWFQSRGLQLPKEGTAQGSTSSVATEQDIVNIKNKGPLQKSEPLSAFPELQAPYGCRIAPLGVTSAALGSGQTSPDESGGCINSIADASPRRKPPILFFKAYIHGHYRTTKDGKKVWVESYTDKRQGGAKMEFAHWNHRLEHVKQHLAHGEHRMALQAFHDLDHADAHRLAVDLNLHDDAIKHANKKDLMQAIHDRMQAHADAYQAKVKEQQTKRPEPDPKTKPKTVKPKKAAPGAQSDLRALVKEAIAHLQVDLKQGDLPDSENDEDRVLVATLKAGLAAAKRHPPPDPGDQVIDVAGQEVPFAYRLIEAKDLAPTEGHADNQYRDRTRAASDEQVANIAGNLKFRLLADSPLMDYGSPVLAKDEQTIIGGNGRTLAIRRAYSQGQADQYKADLARQAERFGFDAQAVERMEAPVLVRVLQKDVDIRQAAIASNEGGGARMSALEQARVDGERLGDLADFYADDDGRVDTAANRPFIRRFLASVPVAQRAAFQASDGGLSQEGLSRLRNAVLHRAYGDSDVLARLVESADPGQRNVLAALVKLAPTVAQVKDDAQAGRLHDLDISADIVAATATLAKVRADKTFGSVDEYLSQSSLFGDPLSDEAKTILRHFDAHLRSAKAIGEFLRDYYDAVRALGDPNQGSLFGDAPAPTKTAVIQGVNGRGQADAADLFAMAAEPVESYATKKPLKKSAPVLFIHAPRSHADV